MPNKLYSFNTDLFFNMFEIPETASSWEERWKEAIKNFDTNSVLMPEILDVAASLGELMHLGQPFPKICYDDNNQFHVEILAGCTVATAINLSNLLTDIAIFKTVGQDGEHLFEKTMHLCFAYTFSRFGLRQEFPIYTLSPVLGQESKLTVRSDLYTHLCETIHQFQGHCYSQSWFFKQMFPYFQSSSNRFGKDKFRVDSIPVPMLIENFQNHV